VQVIFLKICVPKLDFVKIAPPSLHLFVSKIEFTIKTPIVGIENCLLVSYIFIAPPSKIASFNSNLQLSINIY
jgi:hypothetical protein